MQFFSVLAVMYMTHAATGTADLTSFNCGEHSIQIGMSSESIAQNCQLQPKYIRKHERIARNKQDDKPVHDHYEKWTYKIDQNTILVLFKNGKVVRIVTNGLYTTNL